MNDELHIQRFFEEAKNQYTQSAFDHVKLGLKYYREFLRTHDKTILQADTLFINAFREYLYLECGYHRLTAWEYVRGVRDLYLYLEKKRMIQESPVKLYRFKKQPLKKRSYTHREIMRAYLNSYRHHHRNAGHIQILNENYQKIEQILNRQKLHLQTLDQTELKSIAQELDQYQTSKGTLLYRVGRSRCFHLLKMILRWMFQNGYRASDPFKGFKYIFSPDIEEQITLEPNIAPVWLEKLNQFKNHLMIRLRPRTVSSRTYLLRVFFIHLTELKVYEVNQITLEILENYRIKTYENIEWSDATKWSKLSAVRSFMIWLERTDQILVNPIHKMTWPKLSRGLPTKLMSEYDIQILMNAPNVSDPIALRNRTIFELMYSAGIRVGEAAGIRIEDVNFKEGLIMIQTPKGGPDFQRVIPVGHTALDWIKRYLEESRKHFTAQEGCERLLFLSEDGRPISSQLVNSAMRQYAIKSGMRKVFSSHSWRVSCATHMLKNQADIRHVQEQLGHRSISSTQLYTRLCPVDLKKVHQKTHPREREYKRAHAG